MKRIVQYELIPIDNIQFINMPEGAEIISVIKGSGVLKLYALVNPNMVLQPREFRVAGTGEALIEGGSDFIGTVEINDEYWHVFEVKG